MTLKNSIRIFVTLKKNLNYENSNLKKNLINDLKLKSLESIEKILIYELHNYNPNLIDKYIENIIAPKNYNNWKTNIDLKNNKFIAFEYLSNIYNKKEFACKSIIRLYNDNDVIVKTSTLYLLNKNINNSDFVTLKNYLINNIETKEKNPFEYSSIFPIKNKYRNEKINLTDLSKENLNKLYLKDGFSIPFNDFICIKKYFQNKKSLPNYFELKFFDIYWSDHCRHRTFNTILKNVNINFHPLSKYINEELNNFFKIQKILSPNNNYLSLMNLATFSLRYQKYLNNTKDVEFSEENNSCAIKIINNKNDYFVFKNETHNHPTELEPYGGASTCLGGAIRDVFANRAEVLGGIRISGCANLSAKATIKNKLSQKYISKNATAGFSNYGNEIGIPTLYLDEIYDKSYIAKHFECGAVVGHTNSKKLNKQVPKNGDIIILIGGDTGIDGIGGASGSSKSHNKDSINLAISEIQKGNSIVERKLLRLFKNNLEFNNMIKRCNDLGAGGLSVGAVELHDSLELFLELIKTKYKNINPYQIFFSESQERMVCVIDKSNYNKFIEICRNENINAYKIGKITDDKKIKVFYKETKLLDLDYSFIQSNGSKLYSDVVLKESYFCKKQKNSKLTEELLIKNFENLNFKNKKGLIESFDFSINNINNLIPLSGYTQLTKEKLAQIKLPTQNKSFANIAVSFEPYFAKNSCFHLGMNSVIGSMSKIVAKGYHYKNIYFSFQEYFKKMSDNNSWTEPLLVLLGANKVLNYFNLCSISGKDSMSGTYSNINVIPTFLSFAFSTSDKPIVYSEAFLKENNYIYMLDVECDENEIVNLKDLKMKYDYFIALQKNTKIFSTSSTADSNLLTVIVNKILGNNIGVKINYKNIFSYFPGNIIFTTAKKINNKNLIFLGTTTSDKNIIINNVKITIENVLNKMNKDYIDTYPYVYKDEKLLKIPPYISKKTITCLNKKICNILILVCPGTNCEYDMIKSFSNYKNVNIKTFIFKTFSDVAIRNSLSKLKDEILKCDIFVLPGGFSFEDEPDGAAKFLSNLILEKEINFALKKHIKEKKLILGICNGFQALVKSGIIFDDKIQDNTPILVSNFLNKHIATIGKIKYLTNNSPWLVDIDLNKITDIALSNREGNLHIEHNLMKKLSLNGQILSQFVSNKENKTINCTTSSYGIEGLISSDGLILGRMGHLERYIENNISNYNFILNENIFKNGIKYILGKNFKNKK